MYLHEDFDRYRMPILAIEVLDEYVTFHTQNNKPKIPPKMF